MSATIETAPPLAPGLRLRQREARDKAILQAAYSLMDEKGYDAMRMDDIAERVGVCKRTVYHHFASKEAIAVRTMIARIAQSERYVLSLDPGRTARGRLEHVIYWLVEHSVNPAPEPAAFFKAQPALMSVIRASPEYRVAFRGLLDAVRAIVEEAQADGSIHKSASSEMITQLIFGLVRGTTFDDLVLGRGASRGDGRCAPHELCVAAVSILMQGIATDRVGGVEGR